MAVCGLMLAALVMLASLSGYWFLAVSVIVVVAFAVVSIGLLLRWSNRLNQRVLCPVIQKK